jgi:predicted chitinase
MSNYFETLNNTQKNNINVLTKRMNDKGITNKYTQAAILAVASKESAFIPRSEVSYSTTSNERIRQIFGSRLSKYSESALSALKKDDKKFFDAIYGGMYGNAPDEGYKYRGRGFNQLTFKGNYDAIGKKIGIDLVKNPDRLNEVAVASDALIQYFVDRFKAAPKETLKYYNTTDLNGFKNLTDALGAVYHANAGWGKSVSSIKADPTGGKAKAEGRVNGFYDFVKSAKDSVGGTGTLLLIGIVVAVAYWAYQKYGA